MRVEKEKYKSMTTDEKIKVLVELGKRLDTDSERLKEVIQRAKVQNPWFTEESILTAINAIKAEMLDEEKLQNWILPYAIEPVTDRKVVGLVQAGNIPLVGLHDILSVFMSDHKSVIKLSSKDTVLNHFLINELYDLDKRIKERIEIVEILRGFDAVIATGSNNSGRYFEHYFSKVPHIIRKNRNGVAVIHGDETAEDFVALGSDLFQYFGLGCRNVSKIYSPVGYDFSMMLETTHDHFKEIANHNKYRNNYDYNLAIFMLNKEEFLNNGCLLLVKSDQIPSKISSVHYESYDDIEMLSHFLIDQKERIQCIVSQKKIPHVDTFKYGQAQYPRLRDYADGVDTMAFLKSLTHE